jgi:RNA polymerase sigma-70 factor (ECF subfamily)
LTVRTDDSDPTRRAPGEIRKTESEAVMPTLVYSESRNRSALPERTDRELLWALAADDEQALAELVARKTGPLLQVVGRIVHDGEEARDVVQVAFLRLWENRGKFDDRWSPNTWIYRIATNLAIDYWRSRKSRERGNEPFRFHLMRRAETRALHDLASLEESEVDAIFRELAAELPDKQRTVFLLREVEGLSSQEVAEIAGCEESTVRNHLFNARKVLRRELLRRYPEYAEGRRPSTGGGA